MGLFKLPVISIGGRRAEPPSARPSIPFSPAARDLDSAELRGSEPSHLSDSGAKVSAEIPRGQVAVGTRVRRDEGGKTSIGGKGALHTDIPTMFLDNAKEVIARCIQAGIIGDAAARDYFRAYSSYLDSEPDGGYHDFLCYAFGENDEQLSQIASVLNSSLDYPLTRLEVDPAKISGGLNGVVEGELGALCQRIRVPALAASTTDLVVLGVANPYLAKQAEAAFKSELAGLENSYRFYLLLSPSQLRAALERSGGGGGAIVTSGVPEDDVNPIVLGDGEPGGSESI